MRLGGSVSSVAAVTVLALQICGCATLPIAQPEVRGVQPRIKGIDFEGIDLAFEVDVHNAYPVRLSGPRFRYALDIQGEQFLRSGRAVAVDLPALSTGTLTLPVRLSYGELWKKHRTLKGAAEAPYTLHGALILSSFGSKFELPISHSGSFPVLRSPELTAAKVRLSDVSLREATVIVDAEMENPNVFAVGIEDLGYSLDLGDVQVGGLTASSGGMVAAGQRESLTLIGRISASEGLIKLLMNGVSTTPRLAASGSIQTPYGSVRLKR